MDNKENITKDEALINRAISVTIRVGFLAILFFWCYKIISPFVMPLLWGIIISVTLYPVFKKLVPIVGNREKLAAVILTLFALSLIIVPTVLFLKSTVDSILTVKKKLEAGTIEIGPPGEKIAQWPVIGQSFCR